MTENIFDYELSEETQNFVPDFGVNVEPRPVIAEGTETFSMRKAVLAQAMEAVLTDRQTTYGTPEANFGLIADLWTAYKRVDFRPDEVAAMMILLKVARSTNSNKLDNPVDIAGYAACMAEVDPRDMM